MSRATKVKLGALPRIVVEDFIIWTIWTFTDRDRTFEKFVSRTTQHCNLCARRTVDPGAFPFMNVSTEISKSHDQKEKVETIQEAHLAVGCVTRVRIPTAKTATHKVPVTKVGVQRPLALSAGRFSLTKKRKANKSDRIPKVSSPLRAKSFA